jgi:hypothetical protein
MKRQITVWRSKVIYCPKIGQFERSEALFPEFLHNPATLRPLRQPFSAGAVDFSVSS